jgi:hypothetical protein
MSKTAEEVRALLREEDIVYNNPNSDFYDIQAVVDSPRAIDILDSYRREILQEAAERAIGWLHEWIDAYSDYEGAKDELLSAIMGDKGE